jgi:DNA-binding response OmpR family regulator
METERMDLFRVALIDDDPIACREMKRTLQKDRYLIETFCDGESALKMMEQAPFDLIICDLKPCDGVHYHHRPQLCRLGHRGPAVRRISLCDQTGQTGRIEGLGEQSPGKGSPGEGKGGSEEGSL